jgi:hypothetical protein
MFRTLALSPRLLTIINCGGTAGTEIRARTGEKAREERFGGSYVGHTPAQVRVVVEPPTFRWSENRPRLGARQHRWRVSVSGFLAPWSAGRGELAGCRAGGFDGDFVAEAFQALDVVACLSAGVHALLVVVGAEIGVDGGGVG